MFDGIIQAFAPSQAYLLMSCSFSCWPQSLSYALGGLALIGLADLWLLMYLSANFAHARRDQRGLTEASHVDKVGF